MTEQNTAGADTAPAATVPADAAAAAPAPAEVTVLDTPPADSVPADAIAADAVPADAVPADAVPADAVPAEAPAAAPAPAAPPKDRRKLFAFLRWSAAVLVFGAAGTAAAYGVAQPERTDIPGLSTRNDGRWIYPVLAKPTPPPGAPLPFAKDNEDGIHYAGLTQLLLPAPKGSAPDAGLKLEKDSVVTVDTFLEEYEGTARAEMKQGFTDNGLRQIVGRGWTTPDGTRTRVYLLRFHASGFADTFEGCGPDMNLAGVNRIETDSAWGKAKVAQSPPDTSGVTILEESAPVGDEQTKAGCVQSGDVRAVILQTRKGQVASVPLHQTVILQHQLLG
ncbi:hypothetical protein MTF65_25770 [Streptomyces sp. APSN-46.1]|uniref:hypothetical protein n=1 Tax=Streptomyces sp. APSN-46.1 TaxID=2929049 RepID=UPI001FB339D0|nr:hypothetical protein [Streptomyces sp. APSN-46.1]MCJ1680693.1 hypothetical protein [Streptomyces sp. APSN-46.1]